MSNSRLFIYDPESNSAVCIAKGYSSGWSTSVGYISDWFDENPEFNDPKHTRYELRTEFDLPDDANITYEQVKK